VNFLDSFLGAGPLAPKVSSVIQSLSLVEEEVRARNDHWYSVRITPYQTLDHAIRGALLCLVDVNVRRRAAETRRDVDEYAARFLAAIGHPLLIVDPKLRIVWANDHFHSAFQLSVDETVGNLLPSIGARQWANPSLQQGLQRAFSGTPLKDHSMHLRLDDGASALSVGASLIPASSETPMVLVSLEARGT